MRPSLDSLPDDVAINILSKLSLEQRCGGSCVLVGLAGAAPGRRRPAVTNPLSTGQGLPQDVPSC